ncbi:cytochrome-c peroxidase [Marinicellulosiphila megalodicopiae]|uniref:cytochrome-c peroxidase n=1 Tax=Marinicellulosiphila megalodicopiae TaxID=2724896 RepID=UPI003BAED117
MFRMKILCGFLLLLLVSLNGLAAKIVTPTAQIMPYPEGGAPTEQQIQLGKQLFFEPLLSKSGKMSCATCHNPNLGFGDARQFSLGDNGEPLIRHTPHLYNIGFAKTLFWDGRAATLEQQALMPIINPLEMNLPLDEMMLRLNSFSFYKEAFNEHYGALTIENVAKAISAFERSLITPNSPFDRFIAGDANAISSLAKQGWQLYNGKANCFSCHDGADLSHVRFDNIGMGVKDVGRQPFATQDEGNALGKFKPPGLRNVALTAPYMHDGSIGTLEEVIRFYMRGGDFDENKSAQISKMDLTEQEVSALLAFLGTLTDPLVIQIPEPVHSAK